MAGGAPESAELKIVLDASSLVSAILKSGSVPEQVVEHVISCPDCLVLSQAVEEEYYEVLLRPKFDRFVSVSHRLRILGKVKDAAVRVEPSYLVQECADSDDDKYLSLALAASAEVIISSDKRHLLPMHPWRGISIISPADYLQSYVAC